MMNLTAHISAHGAPFVPLWKQGCACINFGFEQNAKRSLACIYPHLLKGSNPAMQPLSQTMHAKQIILTNNMAAHACLRAHKISLPSVPEMLMTIVGGLRAKYCNKHTHSIIAHIHTRRALNAGIWKMMAQSFDS
jgi:hypothetical protein